MPPRGVKSAKRARQYEHIKESELKEGRSTSRAKQIAAATVNKQRAETGEAKSSGGRKKSAGGRKKSASTSSSSRGRRKTSSAKRTSGSSRTTARKTSSRKKR